MTRQAVGSQAGCEVTGSQILGNMAVLTQQLSGGKFTVFPSVLLNSKCPPLAQQALRVLLGT